MTTSNEITLDHIASYFSLDKELESLNLAPTATGGAGINNFHQFPEPQPYVPSWQDQGTEYVKKYLEKDQNEQAARRRIIELREGSTFSINTVDDVDDGSTAVGDFAGVNDLDSEATEQIYATYFNVANRTYDSNLAISRYREEILQQLNINPVIIIQGPTGCGKTTQVPQYILDYHQSKGTFCNIIVTQPRKLAAISIARRVCQERKWQMGTIVGYQVAMDPKISSDTRLSYVTTGVFLEKLVNAKRMDMYTHIIIDEVHERNQDIDFALLLVKKFLRTNSQRVKVILMSATFESSSFASYFALQPRMHPAPVIDIIGKSKEVTEHYLHELKTLLPRIPEFDMHNPTIDPCLYDAVSILMCYFDKIEKIEQQAESDREYAPTRGAVLIFLPGYEEISRLTSTLQTTSFNRNFWIIPLHSLITVDEQTKVFRDAPLDQRKVIISTNIAESSITVPDVKYVIDFCLTKSLVTDPYTNYTCLQLEWASKANCIQRKGRAGRVDIGKVYRMVPRQFYNDLPDYGIPEIKRCPLTKTILHLKKLNLCEPQEMLAFALDPPDLSDIGTAVLHLKEGLALTTTGNNEFDGELTFIGRIMANLPLDIKLSKLIIFGYIFHCLEECIIIGASLSLQSFFMRPFQKALDAYRSRLSWADYTFSDCLCYLNAYQAWKQQSAQGFFRRPGGQNEKAWAEKSFIQLRKIREVDLLVKEIKSRLEKFQINVDTRQRFEDAENILILKMVIAGAFFPNYFVQEPLNEQEINKELNENDPHSTVIVSGLPPKHGILYASALKDMFVSFSQNMVIEFEETKAYIRFQRNRDTTTSTVLQAVYLALKMRKLRMPLEIAVFSPEEAERRCKQLLSSKATQPSNQLVSNRITVKYTGSSVQKAKLPSLKNNLIKIFICNVNNCGHFWARSVSQQDNAEFNFLENTINADQGRNLKPLTKPPEANTIYLAPYCEGGPVLYYRVQIQEIRSGKAKVFFIDYGNVEIVDIKDLREVSESTPDVFHIPAMAFECYLSEVKPAPCNSLHGTWSKEANNWFKNTVNGLVLHAKVYSVVQDTLRVDLKYTDRMGINKSVKDELIRQKLAVPGEESFASKQNNELRKVASAYRKDDPVMYDALSKDLEVSWKEAGDLIDIRKTGRTIRLRGPHNPLEVTYGGLTSIDRCKCVNIERDSVNSVSINPDPQDPYVSMLVAASIGIGQNSQELIARNTTLMPKIRGLLSLIGLLFAPYAEIRTNRARSSYTGALCGLGFDSSTGRPLYPDHDIEMTFDVALDIEDFSAINTIRMGFNLMLDSSNNTLQFESRSIGLIHEQIRKAILQLLKRMRKPKEPEFYRKSHQWNQYLDGEIYEPTAHRDCPHILPLLKVPCLETPSLTPEEMLKHVKDLHDQATKPNRDSKLIECLLCSVKVNSTRDLLVHLDSDEHVKKEELLIQRYRNGKH